MRMFKATRREPSISDLRAVRVIDVYYSAEDAHSQVHFAPQVNVKVKAEHGVPGGLEAEEKAEQSVVNTTVNPISAKEA
ncbi:unnamed protein product [Calypogeia fissa]